MPAVPLIVQVKTSRWAVCSHGFSWFLYSFLMNQQVFAALVRFRLDSFLNAK